MDALEQHPVVPILAGPTGSGKTSLAVELAREYPIEIVSADSRQIIRQLSIGTAKPTAADRQQAPTHLIDVVDLGQRYSAFQFMSDASFAILEIFGRGKLPLVVGGTGLYIKALMEGVVEIEGDDLGIRDRLEAELADQGAEVLHARLREIDPLEAAKIHPHNEVRLIRALELFELTGTPKSELIAWTKHRRPPFAFELVILNPPRDVLYERINARVDQMFADGLLREVKGLIESSQAQLLRSANVIGYNELLDHFNGNLSLAEAVHLTKQNHRRYAKRQITWFRGQTDTIACETREQAAERLRAILDRQPRRRH